jgi:regulator of PEP synthase PpsR (kinase-PPPase family)
MFKTKNVKSITAGLQITLTELSTYSKEQKALQKKYEDKIEALRVALEAKRVVSDKECNDAEAIAANLSALLNVSPVVPEASKSSHKSK